MNVVAAFSDEQLVDYLWRVLQMAQHAQASLKCDYDGRVFAVQPTMSPLDVVRAWHESGSTPGDSRARTAHG
jgi:hypothetical protein